MIVRRIRGTDLHSVLHVMKELPEWFTPDAVRNVERSFGNHEGFAAMSDKRVAGFILYKKWKRTAWLRWMGVAPPFQKKGAGSRLVAAMESGVKRRGTELIRVSTLSHTVKCKPYELTRKFYLKLGFAEERIDKNFYPKGGDRLLLMKRI